MIVVEKLHVSHIPLLHVIDKEKYQEPLPFIIFVHGFESVKEMNLHYAYKLAEKGFRVVLPEAIYHGERGPAIKSTEVKMQFWKIVLTTIYDLESIKNYFERQDIIDTENIGLAGTSMGGIVTLGALTKYPWIKASASLMGLPAYEDYALYQIDAIKRNGISLPFQDSELEELIAKLREFDLSKQPEKLNGRPLLFWHGKRDKIVPYFYAYRFYESIRPIYKENPENIQFILDEKAEHKVSHEGAANMVQWFERKLSPSKMIYVTSSQKQQL